MIRDEAVKQVLEVLAKNLRLLRAEHGISQDELAARSGLDRTYVSGCERAVRNPTVGTLAKLSTALGVEASQLLETKEERDL